MVSESKVCDRGWRGLVLEGIGGRLWRAVEMNGSRVPPGVLSPPASAGVMEWKILK